MGCLYQEDFSVPSDLSAVKRVERKILSALAEVGYSADDVFNMRLALDEACINAIKHGNRNDSGKSIHIRVQADRENAQIEVEDEGAGFDYTRILDPRDIERLHETGGRGLFLIQQFMEQVNFSSRGNSIRMRYQKGKDPDQCGPIRKRIFSGVAILEIMEKVGAEMAKMITREVQGVVSEGRHRIIVDLTRVKEACPDFSDAVVRAAEMVDKAGGVLVVTCSDEAAQVHLGEGRSIPLQKESLPEAVRLLCRDEGRP